MPPFRRAAPRSAEVGFTLVELVVLVAILTIVAGVGYTTLAQRPAQARTAAAAFAGLVSEARALAAVTGDGIAGNSGASIGVVRDGDEYVATLYTYRPILSASHGPVAAPNLPPLRTSTVLSMVRANRAIEPPFAVFFSASGHASAQAPFRIGVDRPLSAEPACPLETGIIVAFSDGVHDQAYRLSCELAQLDLETAVPVGSP